jgi:hypothetical protein
MGSAPVRRALEIANDRDEPMVIVEGNPKLYGRFGFQLPLGVLGDRQRRPLTLARCGPSGRRHAA